MLDPIDFCQGNQWKVNFWVGLQTYITTTAHYPASTLLPAVKERTNEVWKALDGGWKFTSAALNSSKIFTSNEMSCQSNGWNDAGWLEEIINTLIHKNASLFPRVCVPQLTVHRAQQPAALRQEMP